MLSYQSARARYLDDTVSTASPALLLTMLYDRLLADLERAEVALRAGHRDVANAQLTHAQDIVSELAATLNQDAWAGAPQLMSIYAFLGTSLVEANVAASPDQVAAARALVQPLHEAWTQAAAQVVAGSDTHAVSALRVG
ncbi:flagellar export chaperone FliS [Demequina sp.]|uniref:flagellar export chaperone FliS n=1 Tax=Demequina sp. TaxID=2050685 RepID=UPI003A84708F